MNIYTDARFDGGLRRETITRVTDKQAIVEKMNGAGTQKVELRFDRDVGDGKHFYRRGDTSSTWARSSYLVETPELIARYRHRVLAHAVSKVDFTKLNDDKLQSIVDLLGIEVSI